ncbi:uncharacterized protein SRS1_17030 [Sporisorium reilianum f. sp. reilianum]|uniref:Uncharacterized protein n=1 Tax=Sporisorium reilianum f. sp. reilianum TaxID=72559 RepID=A0A2N8UIU9_9BASI|nr:uncharacterized protein SRS1_17030 [Sporisorium reilianum f. sp. reilianum]
MAYEPMEGDDFKDLRKIEEAQDGEAGSSTLGKRKGLYICSDFEITAAPLKVTAGIRLSIRRTSDSGRHGDLHAAGRVAAVCCRVGRRLATADGMTSHSCSLGAAVGPVLDSRDSLVFRFARRSARISLLHTFDVVETWRRPVDTECGSDERIAIRLIRTWLAKILSSSVSIFSHHDTPFRVERVSIDVVHDVARRRFYNPTSQ